MLDCHPGIQGSIPADTNGFFLSAFLRTCGSDPTLHCSSTQIHWIGVEDVAKSTEADSFVIEQENFVQRRES